MNSDSVRAVHPVHTCYLVLLPHYFRRVPSSPWGAVEKCGRRLPALASPVDSYAGHHANVILTIERRCWRMIVPDGPAKMRDPVYCPEQVRWTGREILRESVGRRAGRRLSLLQGSAPPRNSRSPSLLFPESHGAAAIR